MKCVSASPREGRSVAKPLVDDALWEVLQPLIPVKRRRRLHPGRKRLDDRQVLTGILFVLRTGIPWEHLPQEMGCGSGMTCWRRLHEWQVQGVWQRLHRELLTRLHTADRIEWSRAAVDSSSLRAVGAGEKKRAQSDRSRPAGQQAPSRHRR